VTAPADNNRFDPTRSGNLTFLAENHFPFLQVRPKIIKTVSGGLHSHRMIPRVEFSAQNLRDPEENIRKNLWK
jgi:hypothetical protein